MKAIAKAKPKLMPNIKRNLFGELSEGVAALANAQLANQSYLEEMADAKAVKRAQSTGGESISWAVVKRRNGLGR